MVRRLAKATAWLLGCSALLVAVWFGINATDEPLSNAARAALVVPSVPAPVRDNGFLDFLVLGAPADAPTFETALERVSAFNSQKNGIVAPPPWGDSPRVRACAPGATPGDHLDDRLPCLDPRSQLEARERMDAHRTLLARYRAMRAQPKFVNVLRVEPAVDALPAYDDLIRGQLLAMLDAAGRFNAGDRSGALREIERDSAFYRLMARDATTLIEKMVAFALQDRLALFVTELARRMPINERASWRRLEALARAPTKDELDLMPALRWEWSQSLRYLRMRDHAQYPEWLYESAPAITGQRPWWYRIAPYLYRPNQTVNSYVARCAIVTASLAEHPSTGFLEAAKAAYAKADAVAPGSFSRMIINPVGWNHPVLGGCYSDYMARAHAHAGLLTLVRLFVKLEARRLSSPEEIAAALVGPLGLEHPDPFTGKPMRFDAQTRTVGFDAEVKHITGGARHMRNRYGRMALPL